jgi:hypothetical protein
MKDLNNFRYGPPGFNHTPSYEAAGRPWMSSSFVQCSDKSGSLAIFKFPYITKRVVVTLLDNNQIVTFPGAGSNMFAYNGSGAGGRMQTDPIFITFAPRDDRGLHSLLTAREEAVPFGKDVYTATRVLSEMNLVPGPTGFNPPPTQVQQGHTFSLHSSSLRFDAARSAGYPNSLDMNIRTDHIIIGIEQTGSNTDYFQMGATGSFQIYAELTNIPASRMPMDYISGSGINTTTATSGAI